MGNTLREVISGGYQQFSMMAAEKKKAHICAVQYAEMLSATTGMKADSWDVIEVFGTGKGNELVTEKNEINRRFFEHVAKVRGDTPEEFIDIEPAIAQEIARNGKDLMSSKLRVLKDKLNREINAAKSYHDAMYRSLSCAYGYRRELEAMEGSINADILAEEFRKIAKNPFYKFVEYDQANKNVVFDTRNDTILTHKNTALGLDLRVNFGRFRVSTNLINGKTLVKRLEKNIVYGGHYHPHVAADGHVCWGNAHDTVAKLQVDGKFAQLYEILASNLSTYNVDNPYVSLQMFQTVDKASAPGGPQAAPRKKWEHPGWKTVCSNCGHIENECECDEDEQQFYEVCVECCCGEDDCECSTCEDCGDHMDDCTCHEQAEERTEVMF